MEVGLQGQPANGQDKKEAKAGTSAQSMESKAWRDHFGSVRGGPVRRQRRDKEETRKTRGQEDRRKGKKGGGRGELRGVFPVFTLLGNP